MWQTIAKQLSLFSGSEQQNSSEIRNFEAPKIFDFLGTSNKPYISRMLENCILDDLQEIKFLEALVCGKTQEVSD